MYALGLLLLLSLHDIADPDRTTVGLATYDSALHFYSLRPESTVEQMLVVGDIHDVSGVPLAHASIRTCRGRGIQQSCVR